MIKLNRYTTLAALALLSTAASHGAVISAVSATDSSHYDNGVVGGPDDRGAFNTINGTGLSGIGAIETQKHNQYASPSVAQNGGMWLTNGTVAETITFDLGSVQTISQLFVWNYAEQVYGVTFDGTGRGVKGFTLLADNFANPTTSYGSFSLVQAAATASIGVAASPPAPNAYGTDYTEGAQTITLSTPITAQFIRFAVNSNYGGSPGATGYTGLSEVRFGTAVPETSSAVLLGLGLVGTINRRSRRTA